MSQFQVQFQIKNFDQIKQKLRKVEENMRKKVIRKAVKKGGKVLNDEVKRRAPRLANPKHPEYGHLQDQINTRIQARKGWAAARINTKDGFWARFLEYGSGKPNDPYNPNRPGKHAFMRPALDNKGQEAFDTVGQVLSDSVKELVG